MKEEKLYSVHVIATCTLSIPVQVTATSELKARKLAKKEAQDRIDNGDIDHSELSTLEAQKIRIEDIREGR